MISWSLILFSSIVLNLKIGLVWYKIPKCIRFELKKNNNNNKYTFYKNK